MRRIALLGFLLIVGCPNPGPGPSPSPTPTPTPPPVPTVDAAPIIDASPAPKDASPIIDARPVIDAAPDPTGCTAACANMKTQKCPEGLMDNCLTTCISVQTNRLTEFNPFCVAAAKSVIEIQKCGKAVKCVVK